ncbi:MAG: winged helix DNA-binding domain-containing protein [Chloroflexota bacterium]
MAAPRISQRALNRATLARQGLLRLPDRPPAPADAVTAIGSLQAQHPEWPPIALWTRTGTAPAAFAAALVDRSLVRAALMRITVHVVATDHFWPMVTLTQPLRQAQFRSFFKVDAVDSPIGRRLTATHAAVRAALRDGPLRIRDMDTIMRAESKRDADAPNRMHWRHLAATIPLVHVPFEGEGYGRSRYAAAEEWIGPAPADLDETTATRLVTERYLAAFGPASVADVMAYVGRRGAAARWRDALAELGDRIVTFEAEDGRQLHDLVDAPRPEETVPAPPRLLARWDSLLLSHAPSNRERVIDERHRSTVYTKNADVLPTVLIDGRVAGTWDREGGTIHLRPFARLAAAVRRDLERQATELASLLAPDDTPRVIVEH